MVTEEKRLRFVGRADAELAAFPPLARRRTGYNLWLVQLGEEPEDSKPFRTVGPGVAELRIQVDEGGGAQYRVMFVARFPEAIYVLHAFPKKSEATPRHNVDVARARYAQLLRDRQQESSSPVKG